jgi:hypothetical protein
MMFHAELKAMLNPSVWGVGKSGASYTVRRWQAAMDNATPPLSCGKRKVVDGIAGRGNNSSSFSSLGPFI